MFVPTLLVRRATEDLVASALPDAPVRQVKQPRSPSALVRRLRRRWSAPTAWPDPVLEEAEWHMAALTCDDALALWQSATSAQRGDAYAAYRAALEREEAAARELARATRR